MDRTGNPARIKTVQVIQVTHIYKSYAHHI